MEEVQSLECINDFTVSNIQESNQTALLTCDRTLSTPDVLLEVNGLYVEDSLCSEVDVNESPISGRNALSFHDTVVSSFENPCTSFEMKTSHMNIIKPFFTADLSGHEATNKDDLNYNEELRLLTSTCDDIISSPSSAMHMLDDRSSVSQEESQQQMQENDTDQSILEKLQEDLCCNYDDLCRICANKGICLLPLFCGEGSSLKLVEKIHRCLPIKVSDSDDLPSQVCSDCSTKLQICDDFVSTCILANGKLQALKSLKTETLQLIESGEQTIPKITNQDNTGGQVLKLDDAVTENNAVHLGNQDSVDEVDKIISSSSCDSEREWPCNKCSYKAKRKASLILHKQRKHHNNAECPPKQIKSEGTAKINRSEGSFLCEYCDKSFQSKMKWKKHELSHTRLAMQEHESIGVCEKCSEEFVNAKELREHIKLVHDAKEPRIYSCDQCDKSYRVPGSLGIHRATHSSETPYLCDLCGKSFKHSSNLRCHKRSHSGDATHRRHACDLCPKSFPSKFHLSEHRNVHLDITPYSCPDCGKKFHRRLTLRQHRLVHKTENTFECPECGACFNRRGNMTQHMKRHCREKKFICKICKVAFLTQGEVVLHRRTHTPQELMIHLKEDGSYSCEQCTKTFSSSQLYEEHMKTHCDVKYECSLCKKKLSNRRTLEYHMKSFHTGERPYSCQFCSETFLSKECCTIHERVHTGEKPYTCTVCNMSFRCSSNLTQHQNTHKDDRPWACEECPKRFKRKGILLVHMRTHTGERPFCCDQCGRRFSQKNDMVKHQQTHKSPKQVYTCITCSWTFDSRRDLIEHNRTHNTSVVEENGTPSSHSQAVVITTDNLAHFPLAILENGTNIIVHHIGNNGESQIIQVPGQSNAQVLHIADPLIHSVVSEPQVLLHCSDEPNLIQLDESTVLLQAPQSTLTP